MAMNRRAGSMSSAKAGMWSSTMNNKGGWGTGHVRIYHLLRLMREKKKKKTTAKMLQTQRLRAKKEILILEVST